MLDNVRVDFVLASNAVRARHDSIGDIVVATAFGPLLELAFGLICQLAPNFLGCVLQNEKDRKEQNVSQPS
jgi:hypothetical protein